MSRYQSQKGFTIIEMIVSLGVFSVVVVVAVGALLTLVGTNRQLQGDQEVMTNLSFVLDSMTREIRTGTHYYCASAGSATGIFDANTALDGLGSQTLDCPNGRQGIFHGVAFREAGNSITGSNDRILYFFNQQQGQLYRRVGNRIDPITPAGMVIRDVQFVVVGSAPLGDAGLGDKQQPSVTIYIEAAESTDPNAKIHYIQSTVTQRTIDV